MRFTEHELTVAVHAAAKTVAAARPVSLRRRERRDPAAVWESLSKIDRYHHIEAVGSQVLPVLIALPDIEVAAGAAPTFSTAQVAAAVEQVLGEGGGLRRKVEVAARVALVKVALDALPPRQDPDALVVPDSL